MKAPNIIIMMTMLFTATVFSATVKRLDGEVKYRRGLEEQWHDARVNLDLEDIDTILTGEGTVVLELSGGSTFTLGSYSTLDINELRTISRQEMFLFVMSQKVNRMEPRRSKSNLNVENVSSLHGEKKSIQPAAKNDRIVERWVQELNAAKAMYQQEYYPNSVVKLHKIWNRYTTMDDCGQVHYYLGKSFEELQEPGQAIDCYQLAVERAEACEDEHDIINDAKRAVHRLSR